MLKLKKTPQTISHQQSNDSALEAQIGCKHRLIQVSRDRWKSPSLLPFPTAMLVLQESFPSTFVLGTREPKLGREGQWNCWL